MTTSIRNTRKLQSRHLGARTLDKRLPPAFLERVACEATALSADYWRADVPLIDGFVVFRLPAAGRLYVVGVDPPRATPRLTHRRCACWMP